MPPRPPPPSATTLNSTSPRPPPSPTTGHRSRAAPSPKRSPLLPSPSETLLLCLYPALLLLGSLYALLSPGTRHLTYDAAARSHSASAPPPSYFAQKNNVFNVGFVKIGWVWFSAAFALGVISLEGRRRVGGRRTRQALLRFTVVTGWWIGVTQWFFGAPLIDRGFRVTGGVCDAAEMAAAEGEGRRVVTGAACKALGGEWRGGHDLSGHVFMLVLGSAMLAFETGWVVLRRWGWTGEERGVLGAGGALGEVRSAEAEAEILDAAAADGSGRASSAVQADGEGWQLKFAWGVVGLSWWMILMTAVYFHTWLEKLTGLVVAFVALFTVYLLPRGVPSLRAVLGMPGI